MNWKKTVVKTIEYIFYGIAGIQVLFGLVWMFNQFPHMQNWQESFEYLDISRTWVMDEYMSFLYPLLLKVCTGIEHIIGIPFYMTVYVVQLTAIIVSTWSFARKVLRMDSGKAVWAVGYLTSFPLLLQFHMSVRTESLEVSGILALLTFFTVNLPGAVVVTILLIWLNPDMVIVVSVAWLIYLIGIFIKMRKENKSGGEVVAWKRLLIKSGAFALALVMGLTVNGLVQTPGSRGRIQKTFWAVAFQRTASEYFSKSYGMWHEEIKSTFTVEEALEMAKRSDNMMYEVGPALEADWGKEKANEFYKYMATVCMKLRTREIIYQIRDDLVDSVLMPFSVMWQDNGERLSQTGWNYGRFKTEMGGLAKYVWYFSVNAQTLLLLLAMISVFLKKTVRPDIWLLAVLGGVQAFVSVLQGYGAVSYANTLLMILFWSVLICENIKVTTQD